MNINIIWTTLAILLLAYGGAAQNAACVGMAIGLGLYVVFHSDD